MSFMVSLPPIRHLACTRHSRKSHSGSSSKRARKNRTADVGIRLLLSLILLGFGSAVLAQQAIEQEFDFDIPQQAVHTALTEFAEQADLTLVFPDEVVRKKSANALIGKYTLQEGVDILLAGTGLTPRFSDHIVLSISADQQLTNKGNTMNMQKKAPLLKRLGTVIAAAIFATSGAAAIAADDATADSNEAVIEEIVVTATKREKSLQDVPMSISALSSAEVIDSHTVRFNLKRPWGAGLSMLADRGGVMNSPALIRTLGDDYGWSPAGTGPFKVDKVISGTLVHLVRNEHYWGKDEDGLPLPYLDEVTIRVIRDQTVLTSALRSGEIDLAYLPYKDVAAFRRDDRFAIETMAGGYVALLLNFNVALAPVDNVDLRRAISYAINPEVINRAIFFDKVIEADSGMWPAGTWAHDPDVPRPYYDPDKAREFLAKPGFEEGVEFTAVTYNAAELVSTAEIIRAMLKKVGITMNIEVLANAAATENFFHGRQYPLYITAWSRYPEPDWVASLAYKSDGYYNAGNLTRPDIDKLVQAGASLYAIADRQRVYRELNALVLDEAWFVPLLYGVNYAAAPRKVRNLDQLIGWDGKMTLRNIWIEKP